MKDVFNKIAPGWYNFRHWTIFRTELDAVAEKWQKGRLLNIGCAHGPDFLPFIQDFDLYGIDFSSEMLNLARKYSHKFDFDVALSLADACHLPFLSESYDWAISVATYHHIRDKGKRLDAFRELWRVLKPGGEAFITVWNRWQPGFWLKKKETLVKWRSSEKTLYRYYYMFSFPELERMVKATGFTIIKSFPENSYRFPLKFFSRNICLLVKKT